MKINEENRRMYIKQDTLKPCINIKTGVISLARPDKVFCAIPGFKSEITVSTVTVCAWCCPPEIQVILRAHGKEISHGICIACKNITLANIAELNQKK